MGKILRQPATAAKDSYDLIVIGGGIYGVMLSFEASRRGLKSLLLERGDFGGATTFNCLRTLHGGFRYLQTMDLHRFHESVGERRWFLRTFPRLINPLPCLMPLYGNGLRRTSVLRVAAWINDSLSYKRNEGVRPEKRLPASRVITAEETRKRFPSVDSRGLQGGVIWHDACMPDSQLIVIELLRWSCENGVTALNYVEARQLLKNETGVAGVIAKDIENGSIYEYKTSVIVNACGPWCCDVAACFDREEPNLFRSSLAWNVLFNRDALSSHALAVAPKKVSAHTYFLLAWKGKLLAGTGHAPWYGSADNVTPSSKMIQEFINDLNIAVPSLNVNQEDILHIFAGLLPATKVGSVDLAVREVILNHADHGGPKGLYSISGVKFTTARLVAEKTLKRIFPEKEVKQAEFDEDLSTLQVETDGRRSFSFNWYPSSKNEKWKQGFRSLIQEEAVQHLDDLIYRRTTLWENPKKALEIAPSVCKLFPWDDSRRSKEMERLKKRLE